MSRNSLSRFVDVSRIKSDGPAFWGEAAFWSVVVAVAIAIPTVLFRNRFFIRMTPTHWWDYLFWSVTSLLAGLIVAGRRRPARKACRLDNKPVLGVGLTYLAVGCPICNKIVVALLGTSGALTYFAPAQPLLGLVSVALMIGALRRTFPPTDLIPTAPLPRELPAVTHSPRTEAKAR